MSISLKAVAEDVWLQVTSISDEPRIEQEQVEQNAKSEYAWQMLQMYWREKKENGEYPMPSYLLRETELKIVNDEANIEDLAVLRSIPCDLWIQMVGTFSCLYTKTTVNQAQLMEGDDALGDNAKTYFVVGNKFKFPKGVHSNKIPLIYANDGSDLDADDVQVDDAIAALVRERLLASYIGKIAPQDVTNNSNPNQ
jgi:hypothetical protein